MERATSNLYNFALKIVTKFKKELDASATVLIWNEDEARQMEGCARVVSQFLATAVKQEEIGKPYENGEELKVYLHHLEIFSNEMIVFRLNNEVKGKQPNPRILNQFLNPPSVPISIRICKSAIDMSVRYAKRLCLFLELIPRKSFLVVLQDKGDTINRHIAREGIIRMLILEDFSNLSVVPIYGMAGVGKTCLARSVFNDPRVEHHFDLKLWLNISTDHTRTLLLWHVLRVADDLMSFDKGTFDQIISKLQKIFDGKKYLLVLDDLSGEDPDNWRYIEPLLSFSSQYGSKILVTSRSSPMECRGLQLPMAEGAPYELGNLHDVDARHLFQSIAFRNITEEEKNSLLTDIGLEICNKCANNPRVIAIISSILSSDFTIKRWQYFNDYLLTSVEDPVSFILSLDLIPQLSKYEQQLLNYSSLFPVDYEFNKVELNQLWEVQGLVDEVPWDVTGSKEAFNSCFEELLNKKYFIQHCKINKSGFIVFYKAQVLMHEVVKHFIGYGFADGMRMGYIQHASFIVDSSWRAPTWLHSKEKLKSLLFLPTKSCGLITVEEIAEILAYQKALQVLDLSVVNCSSCQDYIGSLEHLRCLRLGFSFRSFPECITKLQFLQTLDLRHSNIRELPDTFHTMHRLRHLYTGEKLIDLPPKFGELKNLQTLDVFIAGENNGLDTLDHFTRLAGKLKIRFQQGRDKHVLTAKASFIEHMNLDELLLEWPSSCRIASGDTYQQKDVIDELELLNPHFTLRSLAIQGWQGVRFPQRAKIWLSTKLNSIHLVDCNQCQYLPSLSKLSFLQSLQLWGLNALEWVEHYDDSTKVMSSTICHFPLLKYLLLANLPQLKGWLNVDEHIIQHDGQREVNCLSELRVSGCPKPMSMPRLSELRLSGCPKPMSMPRLSELRLSGCPNLMSMPLAPTIEILEAVNIDQKLLKQLLDAQVSPASLSASIASPTLKDLLINNVNDLLSLSITIPSLHDLTVRECRSLTNVIIESSSSLRRLKLRGCHSLKELSPSLENFHALEELQVDSCEELNWEDMKDVDEESNTDSAAAAWKGLKSLHFLTLTNMLKPEPLPRELVCYRELKELYLLWLYNMTVLPESIGCLSQLDRFVIRYCPKLNKIPESFPNLKSLTYLEIKECPKLESRCKQPNGEDCKLIQYIPNIHLGDQTAQQDVPVN